MDLRVFRQLVEQIDVRERDEGTAFEPTVEAPSQCTGAGVLRLRGRLYFYCSKTAVAVTLERFHLGSSAI